MANYLFGVAIFIAVLVAVECQYEDVRCKCVCPNFNPNQNDTSPTKKVIIRVFREPSSCTCENVIGSMPPNSTISLKDFCKSCECQWQRRNTTTIKVVVILIICVLSLLVLYMLFLLCLDPLMSRRPKTYLEQQNEEDTQSVSHIMDENVRPRTSVISRVRYEVSKVKGEQQKWKGTVQEQRKNIYDRHTMLN